MDTYVLSWRPQNVATIGLMFVVLVFGYVVVSQVARRVIPAGN